MPLFVLLDSDPAGLVLMVDVEEDHAVILDLMAEAALHLQLHPLLTAEFAPVIYEAVVAPADVLLEPTMVLAVHPAVGIGGVIEEPVYHAEDAGMAWRVVFLDLRHLRSKGRDGVIYERRHGSLLAGVNRLECQTQWVLQKTGKYPCGLFSFHKSIHRIVVANVYRNNFLVFKQKLKSDTIGQVD